MSDQPSETATVVRCILCGYEGPAHDCSTSECRDATLQRIAKLEEEIRLVRGAMAAQDAREREAGEKCGVDYNMWGCDWPDAVAEQVLALQTRLRQLKALVTLEWTNEKPTADGWYWYRKPGFNMGKPCPAWVYVVRHDRGGGGQIVYVHLMPPHDREPVTKRVSDCNGEWAGPMEVPP